MGKRNRPGRRRNKIYREDLTVSQHSAELAGVPEVPSSTPMPSHQIIQEGFCKSLLGHHQSVWDIDYYLTKEDQEKDEKRIRLCRFYEKLDQLKAGQFSQDFNIRFDDEHFAEYARLTYPDVLEYADLYKRAAQSVAYVGAINNLGNLYQLGLGVEKSLTKALLCYQLAAKSGNPIALANVGFCYFYALGVERNDIEAYKHFERASFEVSESNEVITRYPPKYCRRGWYGMGLCFTWGRGVKRDAITAQKCFESAAKRGDPIATYTLACDFKHNELLPHAAQRNYAPAQFDYGIQLFVAGLKQEGREWIAKAARQCYPQAIVAETIDQMCEVVATVHESCDLVETVDALCETCDNDFTRHEVSAVVEELCEDVVIVDEISNVVTVVNELCEVVIAVHDSCDIVAVVNDLCEQVAAIKIEESPQKLSSSPNTALIMRSFQKLASAAEDAQASIQAMNPNSERTNVVTEAEQKQAAQGHQQQAPTAAIETRSAVPNYGSTSSRLHTTSASTTSSNQNSDWCPGLSCAVL